MYPKDIYTCNCNILENRVAVLSCRKKSINRLKKFHSQWPSNNVHQCQMNQFKNYSVLKIRPLKRIVNCFCNRVIGTNQQIACHNLPFIRKSASERLHREQLVQNRFHLISIIMYTLITVIKIALDNWERWSSGQGLTNM